jgi:hypothetical protein
VLVTVLLMFVAENSGYIIWSHYGTRVGALAIGDIVLTAALQLYHSAAARQGRRSRAWPLTLALQAVLVYAFLFPFIWAYVGALGPFLAGSVLLLVPGRWRWAGYAAVVISYAVLASVLNLRGELVPAGQQIPNALFLASVTAEVGLMVYGLSWLAGLARELEGLRDHLARMAAVALKADLIGALIGRDDTRAAAEIGEMSRICAAARADIRLVTGDERRLSLAGELAAAEQILASAGVKVRVEAIAGPLPAAADEVLAPVLREAVTNVLRHAVATACVIEVTADAGALRLHVGNDGALSEPAGGDGRGLANLDARVRAAGGRRTAAAPPPPAATAGCPPLPGPPRPGTGRSPSPPPPPAVPRRPVRRPASPWAGNPPPRRRRPAQVPRLAQHGQDQDPAVRLLLAQAGRGGQPVGAGQVDIDHRHIGPLGQDRGDDAVAVGDLDDHLDVGFEAQDGDQRVAQDPHVLGHQNPDHGASRTRPADSGGRPTPQGTDHTAATGHRVSSTRRPRPVEALPMKIGVTLSLVLH